MDKSFLSIKINRSDKALVSFLNLVEPFLLPVFVFYIGYLLLLDFGVLTWRDIACLNVRLH